MADVGSDNRVSNRIMKEVDLPNITAFQSNVETTYRNAFEDILTDFSSPVLSLVSSCTIAGIYEAMKKLFPLCHFVFATVVSTKRASIAPHPDQCDEGWDGNPDERPELLDRKKRRILSIFFGLLLSRSQRLLPYFSIVETLGLWYKGVQQQGHRTIQGGVVINIENNLEAD